MQRLSLRFSRAGLVVSGLFLLMFFALFAWVFFIASKNPADSGESGILLLPFGMPWITNMPGSWVGPWTGILSVFLNALILYCLFGGLRLKKKG